MPPEFVSAWEAWSGEIGNIAVKRVHGARLRSLDLTKGGRNGSFDLLECGFVETGPAQICLLGEHVFAHRPYRVQQLTNRRTDYPVLGNILVRGEGVIKPAAREVGGDGAIGSGGPEFEIRHDKAPFLRANMRPLEVLSQIICLV